jgi:hypothetical protein
MSHDQTFVAGQVLTAAALNDHTSGRVGYVAVTSSQGSITSITDLTSLTITFTAIASRYYKITGYVNNFSSTTSTDRADLSITDGSNTQISSMLTSVSTATGAIAQAVVAPGAGSITYKLRATRNGAGTVTMGAGATAPCFILIEDLGST